MRSTLYITIVLLAGSFFASAQEYNLRQTNKLFENRAYSEAIPSYEKLEPTQEVLQNLADSYYFTNRLDDAAATYDELVSKYGEIADTDRIYRYGHSLLAVKEYKKADQYLKFYLGSSWNTEEYIYELNKTTPHVFDVVALDNKGSKSDFGMSMMEGDRVAFASSRQSSEDVYSWNGLPYLDLYEARLENGTKIVGAKAFPATINTPNHESNAVFASDGKVMYFNRTSEKRTKVDGVKVANIKIYRAEMVDGQWSNVTALPFSSDTYNTQHPSVSKNGRHLYFSSDMPGGYGGFDLYQVIINEDGTYSEPKNMGAAINTQFEEVFPYISKINTLYFSSNGRPGLGGLDLYRVDMINGKFGSPINLGTTINSSWDDFAYIVDENKDMAYFSSNKDDGIDKIYRTSRKENILTKYQVAGIVRDSVSNELLPGSLVTLMDERGTVLDDMIVGEDAAYLFKIDPNKKYTVRGTRKLYIPVNVDFSTDKDGKISHDIYLTLLSYKDAEEQIKEDRKGDVQVQLDKIYFDFDEAVIRPQAAETLDELVAIMKKYPDMEIEVSSHTDARGPEEYNLMLSKRRAKSTVDYLISQGIDESRLRSIGYGEMQPLNDCVRGGMCSDEEYDINRRSEFKIIQ
ncbi:OmpA family protein [Nonlabens xiamenensis]|uniref:OmpA family protein n=1 Tax=Nonlabens xiamenensis TaxID=2341043 RepID=UPI000F610D77|nr:OmpA family protein [Nonlabens xiamenensis]